MLKDKLLYYRGGGYSGCFWEWNFCFWNSAGVWFDLYSSGREAITTERQALDYIKDDSNFGSNGAELVSLKNQRRWLKFQKDNNAYNVFHITDVLNNTHGYSLQLKCSKCKSVFSPDVENGDKSIDNNDVICGECSSIRTCAYCGEYCDNPDDLDDNPVCGYCREKIEDDFINGRS